jgi:hypothetical protein
VPSNDNSAARCRSAGAKKTHMNSAQENLTKSPAAANNFSATLEQEAGELHALHAGLVRHLSAWRDAHETAIMRLGAVMARIDAMVERIERRGS